MSFTLDHADASSAPPARQPLALDPEVKEDLEHILRVNRKRIIKKYAGYVSSVSENVVKNRDVTVESFRNYVLRLPAFTSKNDASLLSGLKAEIKQSTSLYEILDLIAEGYASFVNYDVFQSIQEKFCRNVKCEDFNYPEEFQAYINKHKVNEFFGTNPQLEKLTKSSKKLQLKFDIEPTTKAANLVSLKSTLCEILDLMPSALRIFSVEEGCIVMTFLIPVAVADLIFGAGKKIAVEQKEALRDLSVIWMKCDDYEFHFNEEGI